MPMMQIRDAQIEFGDRKVFVNESGQKMSILKEVDDDWILRRLERWGSRDFLPLVGPKKGAILQSIIREKDPKNVVEVGSFLGAKGKPITAPSTVFPPQARVSPSTVMSP